MKKQLIVLTAMGLIAVSQMVMSSEQESVEQYCEQQAVEDKVGDDEYEAYLKECIALNQEGGSVQDEELAEREEAPEES